MMFFKKLFAQIRIKYLLKKSNLFFQNNDYYMLSKQLRLIHFLENKYNIGERKFIGKNVETLKYYIKKELF